MLKKVLNKLFTANSTSAVETPPNPPQTKMYLYEPNQQELEAIIQSPFPDGKAPGYVYFVQEYLNGTFKIGKTKNIEKRMNVFGVKLPFENQLVFLIKCADHHQAEAVFHKHFADKRLEGEWFALTKEDVTWVREGKYTPEIEQTIFPPPPVPTDSSDEKPLTKKQLEYARKLLEKLSVDYELTKDYAELTQKDLNRLSGYFRFKNKGALTNLVKAGVLKPKS
ncbi:GIY-YIG nuclease family protein [Planococcus lenghuensis]|uniref:Bacteriophage T5 Orf172 DNA-binding domain-containing protein n=1 Tax=Planococcus lenghuensis TaxID=2213202 RepID=A0A1Q2KX91_9BACL|nr:GIY-YIG nuclease family protein [Planococcus lenghuensis]AQQ52292.1 hypothetical protein B0X71_03650 [Planococcus lenghuensis]